MGLSAGKEYEPSRDMFQDGGKMSRFIDSLKIGDSITIQAPCPASLINTSASECDSFSWLR